MLQSELELRYSIYRSSSLPLTGFEEFYIWISIYLPLCTTTQCTHNFWRTIRCYLVLTFWGCSHAEIFSQNTSIIDVDSKYNWHCTLCPLLKVSFADMTCVTKLERWRRREQGLLFDTTQGPGGAKWGQQEFSGWWFCDPHTENEVQRSVWGHRV